MPLVKNLILFAVCSCLISCARPAADDSIVVFEKPETGVYGLIEGPGSKAAANLWVYAYRSQQGGFRGPADFAARVEADGRYLLDLLPGRWYLVARSRQSGSQTGPPKAGEAWTAYAENPLVIKQQEVRRIDLQLQEIAPTTLLRGSGLTQGDTGFRGQLVGPDSVPVAGAIALVYRDQDYRRMPDHSSAVTSADGRFTLYVAAAGRYCLLARQGTRGQPVQGELYGLLGTGEAACRDIGAGEVLDIGVIHLKPYLR